MMSAAWKSVMKAAQKLANDSDASCHCDDDVVTVNFQVVSGRKLLKRWYKRAKVNTEALSFIKVGEKSYSYSKYPLKDFSKDIPC